MNACLPAGTGAAHLMLFVGGPATHGPGKVVDTDLQEPIRSHKVPGPVPAAALSVLGVSYAGGQPLGHVGCLSCETYLVAWWVSPGAAMGHVGYLSCAGLGFGH